MVERHKRIVRWLVATLVVGGGVFLLSGSWTDPWLWAYAGVWSACAAYAMWAVDGDLANERRNPPAAGADQQALRVIRLLAAAHLVVGALDAGRWHLTAVPAGLRAAALIGMGMAVWLIFRAMRENRFFSAVVRIQSDRGHHVIDSGPYAVVRHPGYAGMIAAVPLSGLALGSWLGVAIALAYSAMIVRRVPFEDAFLRTELEGYAEYAERVRARLVPGLW
jgi:protein-S-isoprenylcysteine O-methyltransferase Ste14